EGLRPPLACDDLIAHGVLKSSQLKMRGTSGELRHPRRSRYRCSLPGLAGFAGPRCTEPEVPRFGSRRLSRDCTGQFNTPKLSRFLANARIVCLPCLSQNEWSPRALPPLMILVLERSLEAHREV